MKSRKQKEEEARKRNEIYQKLSIKDRITVAKSRRGESRKEIARLKGGEVAELNDQRLPRKKR